jgi:hypothetical protein
VEFKGTFTLYNFYCRTLKININLTVILMGKKTAMILGWVLLVVGVLGFISNPLVGEGALFEADGTGNIVHLVSGIVLLWVAYKAAAKAGMVLKVLGAVYLILAVLGFAGMELLLANTAHNALHLVLGAWMLWAGMKAGKGAMPMASAAPMQ